MKSFSKLVAAQCLAWTALASPMASASLVNNNDGSFTDTGNGYLWRTLAQYDGLDYATAKALLPAGYHVASAAELATLTAQAPAGSIGFDSEMAALGANPDNGIIWGYYGDGSNWLWNDGFGTAWVTNAAANPYGWDNWNYAVVPTGQFDGLSLFAVNTAGAQAAVPEPATLGLVGLGLLPLALRRRKASQAARA